MVTRGFTGRGVDPMTAAGLPPGHHVTQGDLAPGKRIPC